ncbi:GAF domain-containing protein [Fusibacter bizertensis]
MACMYPASSNSPDILYPYIEKELKNLLENETNWISNAANAAATLGFLMPLLNWVGFYLYNGSELVLGPFWGKPAVTRIEMGKGVCGNSANSREIIVVEDVHQYPGHIACDLFSNSEIVLPLVKNDKLIGVLDIDSPEIGRFEDIDRIALEKLARIMIELIDFPLAD